MLVLFSSDPLAPRRPDPAIAAHTPRSVWLEADGDVSMDVVMALLQPFGGRPVIVKDFVKSRKHEWAEACFIPSASDRTAVKRAVRRFLVLLGDDPVGGLGFREYVELMPPGRHPKRGMPLAREYRSCYLDGAPVYGVPYWDEAAFDEPPPSAGSGHRSIGRDAGAPCHRPPAFGCFPLGMVFA